jgi:hypothetical protein
MKFYVLIVATLISSVSTFADSKYEFKFMGEIGYNSHYGLVAETGTWFITDVSKDSLNSTISFDAITLNVGYSNDFNSNSTVSGKLGYGYWHFILTSNFKMGYILNFNDGAFIYPSISLSYSMKYRFIELELGIDLSYGDYDINPKPYLGFLFSLL